MSNDIRETVAMSETIKQSSGLARRIYIRSLNAMLTARRHGRSHGFVSVASHLGRFSADLERAIGSLLVSVAEVVQRATELQRRRHRGAIAERTLAGDVYAGTAVAAFRHRTTVAVAERQQALSSARAHLRRDLRALLRLCDVGNNLAVLARVEAGAHADLTNVARETGELVDTIQQRLVRIERALEARRGQAA